MLETLFCFLKQNTLPLWLYVFLALVPVGISIFVFCRQSTLIKQQNKIALFNKKYELYTIAKQLRWFGSKQKLILQDDYKIHGVNDLDKKKNIWKDTLATILIFTKAPDLNKEVETKFHKKYLSVEVERKPISGRDLDILIERRQKEYTYYVRLLHIEMLKATEKIEQMHLLFTLNDTNTNYLEDISEGFEKTYRDLYDEKISPNKYLENIITFCTQLENINCFDEMIDEMGII